jgi:hypothetical protein
MLLTEVSNQALWAVGRKMSPSRALIFKDIRFHITHIHTAHSQTLESSTQVCLCGNFLQRVLVSLNIRQE